MKHYIFALESYGSVICLLDISLFRLFPDLTYLFSLLHLRLSFLQGVEVSPSLKRVAKLMLTPDSQTLVD